MSRFLAVALVAARAAVAAPPPALHLAGCDGRAGEYVATVDDTVLLDRAFLDDKTPEDEQVRAAIRQQLRYLWGYLRTNHPVVKLTMVMSAADPEIAVRAKRAARYGRDLVLDWKDDPPRLVIDDPYTVRAVRRGFTRADDAALAVDYRARFVVALCDEAGARAATSTLSVPTPRDPWLLYWHVPAKERRLMRYFDESAVTNPCSDNDFADLPLPFYYWYDWQPERHGGDGDGKPFDCRGLLRAGVDYFPRAVQLTRRAAPSGDFASLRERLAGTGPITATVLIGALDHQHRALPVEKLAQSIAARGAAATLADPPLAERGTLKLLQLLVDLGQIATVRAPVATVEDGFLRVVVEGTLKRSGRALKLTAWLGLTDIFGPVPPRHWAILRRAVATDQVVIYAGHSGLGENFRLARIEENLKLAHAAFSAEFARAPLALVAFLSCYSYMYFGQDLMDTNSSAREFVYAGTEFTKGDRGALAILDLIDQVLAPRGKSPSLRFVEPGDFLLFEGTPR